MARSRNHLFGLLMALLVCASIEAGSHAAMFLLAGDPRFSFTPVERRLRDQTDRLHELLHPTADRLLQVDPEIGWIYAAGVSSGAYTSTSQGLRGTRLYPEEKPAGTLRIAAFGDSFVHCNEVSDDETWPRRLEFLDDRIEVLNFGVGGHGIDQSLLLYERRGAEFAPDLVILGFSDVTYPRNVNRYQGFRGPTEPPLFKPRFRLTEAGALERLPIPFAGPQATRELIADPWAVLEAAPYDWYFEPLVWKNPLYDRVAFVRLASSLASKVWQSRIRSDRFYRNGVMNEDAEAFALLVALIREFARQVDDAGAQFLLVVFPRREPDLWGREPPTYQPVLSALPDLWIVDLADALGRAFESDPDALFAPGKHYSAAGNDAVAQALLHVLRRRGLVTRIDRRATTERSAGPRAVSASQRRS